MTFSSAPVEPSVLTRARQRDEEAFSDLYQRNRKELYRFIRSRLGVHRSSLVEDIASETFLRAWRAIHTIKTGSNFPAWLTTIAGNLLRDHYKLRHTQMETPMEETSDVWEQSIPDGERSFIEHEQAINLLSRVSLERRTVLFLEMWKGLDRTEIAEYLGVSPTRVGSIRYRAIQSLRRGTYEEDQ